LLHITAGKFKGHRIESPQMEEIRPTSGRVRESFFAGLCSRFGGTLEGVSFLDLVGGSGLMGFEALSRGASHLTTVEKIPAHARLIERNAKKLKITSDQFSLVMQDVLPYTTTNPWRAKPFEVIFMDPPYGYVYTEPIAKALIENGWLNPDEGLLVVEQERRDPVLSGFSIKKYGDTVLLYFDMAASCALEPEC
jgi:16S rRNA (guanine966-N2)-methyltransferase